MVVFLSVWQRDSELDIRNVSLLAGEIATGQILHFKQFIAGDFEFDVDGIDLDERGQNRRFSVYKLADISFGILKFTS